MRAILIEIEVYILRGIVIDQEFFYYENMSVSRNPTTDI